jgi:predicted transcriptional regulator YheO
MSSLVALVLPLRTWWIGNIALFHTKRLSEKKIAMARSLYADKHNTINGICKTITISKPGLYRYLKAK